MFKPGDKVVRSRFNNARNGWAFGDKIFTVKRIVDRNIHFMEKEIPEHGWQWKYFELAKPSGPRCGITRLYQKHGVL